MPLFRLTAMHCPLCMLARNNTPPVSCLPVKAFCKATAALISETVAAVPPATPGLDALRAMLGKG